MIAGVLCTTQIQLQFCIMHLIPGVFMYGVRQLFFKVIICSKLYGWEFQETHTKWGPTNLGPTPCEQAWDCCICSKIYPTIPRSGELRRMLSWIRAALAARVREYWSFNYTTGISYTIYCVSYIYIYMYIFICTCHILYTRLYIRSSRRNIR